MLLNRILKTLDSFKSLLPVKIKRKIKLNLFSLFCFNILEYFGLLILIPIIQKFFTDESPISFFNQLSLNILVLIALSFFLLKYLFSIFHLKRFFGFIFEINRYLNNHLIKKIFNARYCDVISDDLKIIKNIFSNEISTITYMFLMPLMHLLSDFILIFLIVTSLIIINFKITFFIFLFTLIIYLIYRFYISKTIDAIGFNRKINERKKFKLIDGIFNLFDLLKTNNKTTHFKNLDKYVENSNLSSIKLHTFQLMVKQSLEIIVLLGFILTIFVISLDDIKSNLVFILFLLLSLIRLIPLLSRIITNLNNIRFSLSVVNDFMSNILNKFSETESDFDKVDIKNHQIIEFKNISYSYSNSKIQNINFNLYRNQSHLILGKSGIGKTTFIKVLLGLLKPTSGTIIIDKNKFISSIHLDNASYVPQKSFFLDDTILNNLTMFCDDKKIDINYVLQLIKLFNLDNKIKNKKYLLKFMNDGSFSFSEGELQRLSIIRSLYSKPDVLILDEPTSSLDKKNEKNVISFLTKSLESITIVCISHNNDLGKYFNNVVTFK